MKSKSSFSKTVRQWERKVKFFKFKLFLFLTLPAAIITIGQAVIKEYTKIKMRQLASSVKSELPDAKDCGESKGEQ